MKKNPRTKQQSQPLAEIEDLRRRLEEAEETLRAIHEGEVDALVVSKPQGEVVFTLKGAEQPYRVFVEAMNEGAVTLDPEGTILYCNNRFAEMLKLPADRVIGSSIYRFIPLPDRSGFESAFQGGKQQDITVDISLKREDQDLIPVHLSFNMLHGQDVPVVCMVAMDLTEHKRMEEALRQFNVHLEKRVEDRTAELIKVNEILRTEITERKRAEGALQESQALLRAVMENTSDPVYVKDRQSRILMCNPALEKVAGKRAAEIIGKTDSEYYEDPGIGQALRENDLRVMESGRSQTMEETAKTRDGDRIFLSSKAPYLNESGDIMGIIGISHDITERKQAEKELQRSREELEMRVQERTQELESINEELKTENEERLRVEIELRESEEHLRQLSTELLNAQEKERRLVAQEIHDSIGSSLAATKFKVETALSQAGKNNLETEAALKSVIPVIQGAIDETRRIQMALRPSILDDLGILATIGWFCRQYESTYSAIRVRQEIDIKEEDVADSRKTVIFRVLQEAMNNIAKHSKANEVSLHLYKFERTIQLVIRDNGHGFDPLDTHLQKSTTRGLGLVSMRERVELSGGSFAIESAEGKGTTVLASWPL